MKHFLHLGWFKNILRWKYSWTCLEKFYRAFNFLNRVFAECKTGFYASKMQLLKERKKVPFYNRLPIKIKSLFSKTFSVKISTFEEKLKAQCVEISTFVSKRNSRVKVSINSFISSVSVFWWNVCSSLKWILFPGFFSLFARCQIFQQGSLNFKKVWFPRVCANKRETRELKVIMWVSWSQFFLHWYFYGKDQIVTICEEKNFMLIYGSPWHTRNYNTCHLAGN